MDVRCPQCHVEYEFDDNKVTATGVTVKCTSCEHVFKVRAPEVAPAPLVGSMANEVSTEWMVKQRDGRTFRFRELTTLQKWIVEQKVERDDVISKTGRSWKKLGEIAELASFFQVVDAARAAQRLADGLVSQKNPVAPGPVSTSPPPPPAPPAVAAPAVVAPAGITASAEFYAGDVKPLDNLHDLDDDDPVLQWKRRRLGRNLVVGALFAVGAVGIGAYAVAPDVVQDLVARIPGLKQAPPPNLGPLVDPALGADTAAEIDPVIEKLEAEPSKSTVHHAALSRLYTAKARAAAERARLELDEGKRAAASKASTEAMQKAYSAAVQALSQGGETSTALLANADYQALKGALTEMETDLGNALANAAPDDDTVPREAAIIRALGAAPMVVAAAPENRAAALASFNDKAEEAQKRAPGSVRLAYTSLALRALVAPGLDENRALLEETKRFASANPEHDRARLLAAQLETRVKALEPQEAPPPDVEEETEGEPESEDFGAIIKRADRLRRLERTEAAQRLYQKATTLKPTAWQGWVGLGWTNLDLDRSGASVRAFERALSLRDGLPEALLGLGEAHRAAGNKAAAIDAYKGYLDVAPNGPEAPVARNAIKRLEEN